MTRADFHHHLPSKLSFPHHRRYFGRPTAVRCPRRTMPRRWKEAVGENARGCCYCVSVLRRAPPRRSVNSSAPSCDARSCLNQGKGGELADAFVCIVTPLHIHLIASSTSTLAPSRHRIAHFHATYVLVDVMSYVKCKLRNQCPPDCDTAHHVPFFLSATWPWRFHFAFPRCWLEKKRYQSTSTQFS